MKVLDASLLRTKERIRAKRAALREKQSMNSKIEHDRDIAPRLKWRSSVKEKRMQMVSNQVDRWVPSYYFASLKPLVLTLSYLHSFLSYDLGQLIEEHQHDYFATDDELMKSYKSLAYSFI